MAPRRFVFNPPAASIFTGSGATRYLAANVPTIILEEILGAERPHERHSEQLRALGLRSLPDDPASESSLFGDDLRLACREYVVRRAWVDDLYEREQIDDPPVSDLPPPLGNAPPRALASRPIDPDRFIQMMARVADPAAEEGSERLFLFNVIVALEWIPSPQRLRRLQWAFRRASDYLYDVTNGGMAFGQVVFAGPDWLHCADIQILASNRYLPRSWVGGMLEPHKYTPIRLGRGLWVRDRRVVIDWDEAEGYRSIVHEWGHYALGLKDGYMRAQAVYDHGADLLRDLPSDNGGAVRRVVLLDRRVKSESIMASAQGNSELGNPLPVASEHMRRVLRDRYPGLLDRLEKAWNGPGLLPLPLPHFRLAGGLDTPKVNDTERVVSIPFALESQTADQPEAPWPLVSLDHDTIPTQRWEAFLMRSDDEGDPQRISAQGEIDARAPEHGFTLLGVTPGDTLVLVGSTSQGCQVWSRPVDALDELKDKRLASLQWERIAKAVAELEATQRMAVFGESTDAPPDPVVTLLSAAGWVRHASTSLPGGGADNEPALNPPDIVAVSSEGGKQRARVRFVRNDAGSSLSPFVFGIDGVECKPEQGGSDTFMLPSLDGYVVFTRRPGPDAASAQPPLLITDFSQGGPPKSAPTLVSDPISAGASSGEALMLCDVRDTGIDTDPYRVVTSIVRGAALPAGTVALSPVVSVATNIRLLKSFTPTLLIVSAFAEGIPAEQMRICRIKDGQLERLPTYVVPGGAYAVTPLADGGSDLVTDAPAPSEADGVFCERFVLARVP